MVSYFWIQNSEDGVSVRAFDYDTVMEWIKEGTRSEVLPEYRNEFVNFIPDDYTDTKKVCIVKDEIIIPKPVTRVTEWEVA